MSENLGTVLLVDDDADARTMLGMLLSGYDMEVQEASTGLEALEQIAVNVPGLVLLDFDMPGLNGVETLQRIRERFSDSELPVVMVSNRQDSQTIVSALDHGANDYVTKSSDPAVIQARLRRHLIHKKLPRPADRPFGGKLGPYLLEERLADGAFAATYSATEAQGGRVALKVFKPGYGLNETKFNEWGDLRHPLLADLLGAACEPVDYLVYEFISGRSFHQYLAETGPFTIEDAVRYGAQIAEALEVIHGLDRLHGELRPSTVMMTEEKAVLLDFGFSELLVPENSLTRSDHLPGHPAFLAPEYLLRKSHIDVRSDLYALGALLYTMTTGQYPFLGGMAEVLQQVVHAKPPKPGALRPDGDKTLDFLCGRLLSKDPADRYSTAADVSQKLRELGAE